MVSDWKEFELSEIGIFEKGSGISRSESNSGTLPAIRYGELYTHHDDYVKSYNSYISSEVASKSVKITYGDIVFACSGETKEDIGKCAAIIDQLDVYAGGDLIILHPKVETDPIFLGTVLNAPYVKKQRTMKAQGDAIVHISVEAIKTTTVKLPPLHEQKVIASALSDVDELIANLEKLIEKKKAITQGTMQELLSGKKRLPGFVGTWKNIKFKEANIEVLKGQIITQKESSIGNIPVIAGGKTPAYYCDKFNRTGKNITISASGASAGFVNKYSGNIFASDCSTISESYKYDIDFVYYLLLNVQTAIYASQTGGAQPHIHPKDIYEIDVCYTFDLSEQTAIASILSDMDNEIEALEQKLVKTRYLKQGMMQQLLTGEIRLV